MLVACWIAGWIANSIVSWQAKENIPHDDHNLYTFCFGNFCILISNPGFNNLNYHKSNKKLMWYKINVEQSSCNNYFDLLFSMEFSFLYFDLLAKSELIWLVYWKQKDWWTSTCNSSCSGTLDGKIIKLRKEKTSYSFPWISLMILCPNTGYSSAYLVHSRAGLLSKM